MGVELLGVPLLHIIEYCMLPRNSQKIDMCLVYLPIIQHCYNLLVRVSLLRAFQVTHLNFWYLCAAMSLHRPFTFILTQLQSLEIPQVNSEDSFDVAMLFAELGIIDSSYW